MTEERERLGERTSPEDDLGAPVGDRVERRKALVDADRIVRAQDGDGRSKLDCPRAAGNRAKQNLRRGNGKVGTMVFADSKEVQAELVRENSFFHDIAQHARVMLQRTVGGVGDVAKCVETEFDCWHFLYSGFSKD